MNRRTAIQTLTAAPAVWAQGKRKPNFIVVLMDDLGCTDLSCYGASDMKTKNIDALAASGTRFTNWYSNAPVCAPARGALMTGRYPVRAGIANNGAALTDEQKTIAALLKTQQYKTGLIGKWHLGTRSVSPPNDRGFDYFYGFHPGCVDFYSHRYYWGEPKSVNYHDLFRNRSEIFEDGQYLTERLTEEAVQFVGQNARSPFFLYLAYNAPHYPMHAPKKYMDRFTGLDPERQVYAAMVSAVDDGIGALREELRRHGLLDDTCIFLLGDNGATTEPRAGLAAQPATAGKNKPYRGYKFSLFDGGMHVAGMMSWPGHVPAGKVSNEVVMSMDVLPTITGAAGVSIPSGHVLDGRDILPVVSSGAKLPHDAIYWMQQGQLAIRRGKWKLVENGFTAERWPEGQKRLAGDDALFLADLEADPGESKNLRRENPNVADELATMAHKWQAEMKQLPAP